MQFKAYIVKENDSRYEGHIGNLSLTDLPDNDVLVKVHYSSLNYKDALSSIGNKGVTRQYPHVPGIDAAGEVVSSKTEKYTVGQKIIVTGYDLGMNTWGGFGQYISVPTEWIVPLPDSMSLEESMMYGTAGLTAGLSIAKVLEHIKGGRLVISGATGGVGSLAAAMAHRLGFETTAVSGKQDERFFKDVLQVDHVVSRTEFVAQHNAKPLSKGIFDAGIDTVGGDVLSGIVKSIDYNGVTTCCGMVASAALQTSIFPFILRGVSLLGVDSVQIDQQHRCYIWGKLASEWKPDNLSALAQVTSLEGLPEKINEMLKGNSRGRCVVRHDGV
ncbi:MAG: YhdH/YhfP family quinone oxidoreductase [Chitinophagaceae bacterium]